MSRILTFVAVLNYVSLAATLQMRTNTRQVNSSSMEAHWPEYNTQYDSLDRYCRSDANDNHRHALGHYYRTGCTGTTLGQTLVSGCFNLDSHDIHLRVPSGVGPFPVLIILHWRSGDGCVIQDYADLGSLSSDYILVGPSAIGGSWGITDEKSSNGIAFVNSLIDALAQGSNANPHDFTILGMSMGAVLTNLFLIESEDTRIKAAITVSSQLSTTQWHDGNFFKLGTATPALTKRRLLQFTGAKDRVVPASGGQVELPGVHGMLGWDESASKYAEGYGSSGAGSAISRTPDGAADFVTFLNGSVQAYNYLEGEHVYTGKGFPMQEDFGITEPIAAANQVLLTFLEGRAGAK